MKLTKLKPNSFTLSQNKWHDLQMSQPYTTLCYFISHFLWPTLYIYNFRDKYVRPYDKSTFVQELENNLMHDLAFDLEFSELEQLADDTIQVNLISGKNTA